MARGRSLAIAAALLGAGCSRPPAALGPVPQGAEVSPHPAIEALVLTHGGQGSPADRSDGPAAAAAAAHARLLAGDDAPAAALVAVRLLEDDPRFNAGTGANLRIDGSTIQCDAAVMDDDGHFGAVAGLSEVRHPVDVAWGVAHSPHSFLAGPGAQRFATALGHEGYALEVPEARARLEAAYRRLFAPAAGSEWARFDWRRAWNFASPPPASLEAAVAGLHRPLPAAAPTGEVMKDTVGVVVRTATGRFAAALSTGGTALALDGRVGDVPQLGAGLYAGRHGAVAATGKGEAIVRERVAATAYELLARGVSAQEAARRATRGITPEEGVGLIVVSPRDHAVLATTQMAWGAHGQVTTRGDEVVW